jgi:hypothetical protein
MKGLKSSLMLLHLEMSRAQLMPLFMSPPRKKLNPIRSRKKMTPTCLRTKGLKIAKTTRKRPTKTSQNQQYMIP